MNEITHPSNRLVERQKDPLAVELGRRGGLATYRKYGKQHYKKMRAILEEKRHEGDLDIRVE